MEADKELDELRKELADCRLDTNAGTERTLRIIIAWRNRAEKRAYKQGWDSAGGEVMEETHRKEIVAARIDELKEIQMSDISDFLKDDFYVFYIKDRLQELTKEEGAV